MNPFELLRSVYLGDRACKALVLDGLRNQLAIQVDEISRIRSPTGRWDYNNEENITDGWLVFRGVRDLVGELRGAMPNDFIEVIEAGSEDGVGMKTYRFEIALGVVDVGGSTEVKLTFSAESFHLEDPTKPGTVITD